jgi:NAD(P)-dependent dehydrogenase (short-subunit alcohol dehydrogenase family)
MFKINKMVIVVTGSGKGIGYRIAKELQAHGAKIIRIDKSYSKKIENSLDIKFDLKNLKSIKNLVNKIKVKYNRIDGLVNCAGVTYHDSLSQKEFDETFKVNLFAAYQLTKYICPLMAKNKKGSIINITSLGATFGFSKNPSYQMSKAALKQLTKSVAVDWGSKGIRCNNISPGYINSGMTNKSFNKAKSSNDRTNRMIIKRWGNPQDLVGPVIFLLSSASNYITGADINVDGGWSIKGI